ncbi:MAG: pyridoxamine 5'-phosphate oxidase family protein [Proteobacteria bacterium]|nr:pyridoxamine 5'-phosphate oxidase family protein [Pseudomonadota bacterium]
MPPIAPATRTTLARGKDRAAYDADSINSILDASFLCHVGFIVDGEARVIPTAYVRIDDAIYLHGHLKNQMMNALLDGQIACISVTLLDGLVLARSGFHHSVNYRSVTLFGRAELVPADKKVAKLDTMVNHLVPGRAPHLREHTQQELNATLVVRIPIDEAAAKIRLGPPIDADKDYDTDIWAGVVKVETVLGEIDPCPRLKDTVQAPEHVLKFHEQGKLFQ